MALVVLEVLAPRFTLDEARAWLEQLMLIHVFDRVRDRRDEQADTVAILAALRRPRGA